MPHDLLDVALRNHALCDLAFRNLDVSQTFVAITDRLVELFGDEIDNLEIAGPHAMSRDYDASFALGGK